MLWDASQLGIQMIIQKAQMASLNPLTFYSFILLLLAPCFAQQSGLLIDPCLYSYGNFTSNSTYHSNLNQLLSNFSSISPNNNGFYNISVGRNPNQIYGVALCRGDATADVCLNCITGAASDIRRCPTFKAAQFYDNCMLRYSNNQIIGVQDKNDFFSWAEGLVVENVDAFNDVLTPLLEQLRSIAAKGDSFRKFAVGKAPLRSFETIYALVECTPDLSQLQCSSCLSQAFESIPICCHGRRGGRVFGPSCVVRFRDTLFFNDTDSFVYEPPGSPQAKSSVRTTIIVVLVSVSGFMLLISICIYIFFRRKKSKKRSQTMEDQTERIESLQYDFGTIRAATNNFSDENKLGQGGFGAVYKGRLDNGQEIAVKRLSMASNQGDQEFKNEVQLVARLQHRNLVGLQGFSLEEKERLLIYEFVTNSSLDHFLFDPTKRILLDWGTRYKIIAGIAKGLLYLHEDSRIRIIHRDMKASNVLLDTDMNPKISDFGMARLFLVDQTQDNTSKVVGTYGYMAPEYVIHGHLSIKTDVYSYGVLVLEIMSGQKISALRYQDGGDTINLLRMAWECWREGTPLNIIDPNLRENSNEVEMMRCIDIGLLCVQENVARRPTMSSIVVMLTSDSVTLQTPSPPPFCSDNTTQSDWSSSQDFNSEGSRPLKSQNESDSVNEVSITELDPR